VKLNSLFPSSKTLAAKPTAATVTTKSQPSALADLMGQRKQPGQFTINWPKMRTQGVKDYKVLTTQDQLIAYCARCEQTNLGGFDYETSGDASHRIPPLDEENNTISGKQLDTWLKNVNLDPQRGEVCAMSLSAAPDEARAIFIDNPGSKQFEPTLSRVDARKLMFTILEKHFFTSSKIVKIAVNMNFEEKYTAKYGKYILMPVADPFVMWIRTLQLVAPHKINNPKRPYVGKGLKPMTFEYFGVRMGEFTQVLAKNNVMFFDEVSSDGQDAVTYCCEDSDYAVQHYLYWDSIAKQIENDNSIYKTYSDWLHNIEMPFTRVTGLMEYWGMNWDSNIAEVKREEAQNTQEAAAADIAKLALDNFDLKINVGKGGKTGDVRSFIFDTLKLPVAAYTETKAASLDGNALMDMIFMLENKLIDPDEEKYLITPLPDNWETLDPEKDPYLDKATRQRVRIANREEHPHKATGIALLNLLIKIQKYSTLLSSHIQGREKWVNIDGRIHAGYEPWTETGRLSSSHPNGQNVPRPDNDSLGVRNFYTAAPGKVLILEDESGFELRLTAWKSKCPVMIPAFINNEDLHRKTAATMTGKLEKDVTKHERSTAKPANFGSVYGGTEYALQATFKKDGIRKSLPECKLMVDAVLATYPGIPLYQVAAVVEAREKGYSETIYGFKRLLPNINSASRYNRSSDERRSQNTPIQGSAADIMKKAQVAMYEKVGLDTAYFNTGALVTPWEGFDDTTKAMLAEKPFMQHGRTDMIAQIHDEIISEVDDEVGLVKQYADWQKRIMEIPPLPGFPIPLVAEASAAYSWGTKMDLNTYFKNKAE
jgi:DNA polymerase-1